MANTCFTNVVIVGPTEQIDVYMRTINEICFDLPEDSSGLHLTRILNYLGIDERKAEEDGISARGYIETPIRQCFETSSSRIEMEIISKWVTQIDPLVLLRDKVAPDLKILYTSEEPMMDFFESSDPEVAGKYYLDAWEEIPDVLRYDSVVTEEKLHKDLESVFGEGSFRNLLQRLGEEYAVHLHYYNPMPAM